MLEQENKKAIINQHSRHLFAPPTRAGFASSFGAALLLCLLAGASQVDAQQPNWSPTGDLNTGRFGHPATVLASGKVLVAGGRLWASNTSCNEFNSAELYDPATGTSSDHGRFDNRQEALRPGPEFRRRSQDHTQRGRAKEDRARPGSETQGAQF